MKIYFRILQLSAMFILNIFDLYSSHYTVRSIGAELLYDTDAICWGIDGITDGSKIYGTKWKPLLEGCCIGEIWDYDEQEGFTFFGQTAIGPIKGNNLGQLVGYGSFEQKPMTRISIWSKNERSDLEEISDLSVDNILNINDSGQIIGYTSHAAREGFFDSSFIWENGILTIIGPQSEIAQQFTELGFHVMSIRLLGINNKGELAGCIGYGKYNKNKQKYELDDYKAFFWDGMINLIPLPKRVSLPLLKMKVANSGFVLISTNYRGIYTQTYEKETYLWDRENGTNFIENFEGLAINDNGVIVGTYNDNTHTENLYGIPAVWKKGKITKIAELLGVDDLNNLPSQTLYDVEAIKEIKHINNRDQMTCKGLIDGQWYPFVLEPTQDFYRAE